MPSPRRGLQPTWTAPSGRSSTGRAGSSAYNGDVGCAIQALCHGRTGRPAQLSTAPDVEARRVVDHSMQLRCSAAPSNGSGTKPFVKRKVGDMTIVNAVAIHPRSGEVWDELQKQLKKAIAIVKKHGGENVTLLVTVIGGQQTNSLTMLVTAENWIKFGQIQEAVYGDPEMQALMRETGKIATWEIYTAQTLEL